MIKKILCFLTVFIAVVCAVIPAYASSAGNNLIATEPYAPYGDFYILFEHEDTQYNISLTDSVFDASIDSQLAYGDTFYKKSTKFITYPAGNYYPGSHTVTITSFEAMLDGFTVIGGPYVFSENNTPPSLKLPSNWKGSAHIEYDLNTTNYNGLKHQTYDIEITGGEDISLFVVNDVFTDYTIIQNYKAVFIPMNSAVYSDTVCGVYELKDFCESPPKQINEQVTFTSNGSTYNELVIWSSNRFYYRPTVGSSSGQLLVYNNNSWQYPQYKTIDFGTQPQSVTAEFSAWLEMNAVAYIGSNFELEFTYDINTSSCVTYLQQRYHERLGVYNQNLGYAEGQKLHNVNWVDWIVTSVGAFFSLNIFPGLSIGLIFGALVVILLVVVFIKIFGR